MTTRWEEERRREYEDRQPQKEFATQPEGSEAIVVRLTKALEEIRERSNKVHQMGDAHCRRALIDNYNTSNVALMSVGRAV